MRKLLHDVAGWVRSKAAATWRALAPHADPGVARGAVADVVRSRGELVLENAMLRQKIIVLRRKCSRPRLTRLDRLRLLVGAAMLPGWRRALAIVQPETLLRWHREGFRTFWRGRSRAGKVERRLAIETITLIGEMAGKNRLWGAERIRGELLKVGIRVSKRTIQKYMRSFRPGRGGQTWSTFVKNHAHDIWCCDFVQTYDLLFRPLLLFFLLNQGSRKVVYMAATRNPAQEWTAQQLRNATMDGLAPRFLIRDRDEKFGATFDRVAEGAGARVIKTAVRAPNMNPIGERFVGSLRREALDHVLLFSEEHLGKVAGQYAIYLNKARPHQGIGQRIPDGPANDNDVGDGKIIVTSVLGGLHHDYRRVR
jgi:transposase InsO family protein